MNKDIQSLSTEQVNEKTSNIDEITTLSAVNLIIEENISAAKAVETQKEEIAKLVEISVKSLENGGRIIYAGAGTSGRLGVLDASEILPTFGVGRESIDAIIAGGDKALRLPVEGIEDNELESISDLNKIAFNSKDILIGIAASGRTPYVLSAITYAKSLGAITGSISTSSNAQVTEIADYPVEVVVGPEPITGSTRMKSGTAQKIVLNIISTLVMVETGKTFGNYMINLKPLNSKLKDRSVNILSNITNLDEEKSRELLIKTDFEISTALVVFKKNISPNEARELLEKERKVKYIYNER